MKKLLFFFLSVAAVFTACQKDDFLEPKTNILTEDSVFTDSIRTMGFLGRVYGDMSYAYYKGRWNGTSSTEVATDDAEFRYNGTHQPAVQLYNGSISALNFSVGESYDVPWRNIRRVNLFLQKLPTTPLSGKAKTRLAAEARFLRAWFYQTMLNHFGGMPLIGDKAYGPDEVIDLPRNTYAECVDYIVSELDDVAKILDPNNTAILPYTELDYGRITKGACMALKSRLLLQAASPLFNGQSEAKDPELLKIVAYPTYSQSHWQRAADAAKAVMDSRLYSLNTSTNA
ncbi:MAG TPA: RagB/SusD family nutrient uptake outer membrane protein, partial [Hymenobacter sp.]